MAVEALCIGDLVCLYSEESFGYVYSTQYSSVHSELAVFKNQARDRPTVPDPQMITFQLSIANRYILNKNHRKLKARYDENPDDHGLRNEVAQALVVAEAETEDNVAEQKRQHGKKIVYGQIIQLKHQFSQKYVHVSATKTSRTESNNMQVDLLEYNDKHALFRIMPRYKVKAEGDVVQVDDQVVLESVKSGGQYLHASKVAFGSRHVYAGHHELNLSVRQSGFSIYRRYKPEQEHENMVKPGVPIRLFHKEIEAYMVAEGLFDDEVTEDVHLRVRPVDQSNPRTLRPSTSAITYWQIELLDGMISGDSVVHWEQKCHFKHMCTRKYLRVEGKHITLTDDHTDPQTVFKLHPVIKEREEIEYQTYCRIEHAETGHWLHADDEVYKRKKYRKQESSDSSMAGLEWTRAKLKKLSILSEMQYVDAFTLEEVNQEDWSNFNIMVGKVPSIQKILSYVSEGLGMKQMKARQTSDMIELLGELKQQLVINQVQNKKRQKLFRNLRIVELLVRFLKLSVHGSANKRNMTRVKLECYETLYKYLMGNSRKNELYIAQHISFFQDQIDHEGQLGLHAAHMVMELSNDNRKVVDRITRKDIDRFIELLQKNKNYRYLDLLGVLCVCDGVSIPDNQTYITQTWLAKGIKNCVYHTELGQAIGKDANVVYISKDNCENWIRLHDFVNNRDEKELHKDKDFLFLEHQLDLFGKLCYGRNEYAIRVITEELGYLTWEEAYSCLINENLPNQLRAKYCHLIIALFVDIGQNLAVLDRINLTFVYNLVGKEKADEKDAASREKTVTKKYFLALRYWISEFLEENKDMTASDIGHNMLIQQVLRLVHYLARFGYYGNLEDVKQLMEPLSKLVDGRNDKPYPNEDGFEVPDDVMKSFSEAGRYKKTSDNKAVIDAKYQAMEVLDLFYNYRFNIRLENFVEEFKKIYDISNSNTDCIPELGKLLSQDYNMKENEHLNQVAISRLEEIFQKSEFFTNDYIVAVLLDLSHYDYNKMVQGSMTLLNRIYSTFDNLFKRAVQAQVLITDQSIAVLAQLHIMVPTMQRLTSAKMSQEQTKTMGDILVNMIGMCSLKDEPEEAHPMNQNILYNYGILDTVFDILSQEIDIRLLDQYGLACGIFQKAFQLLEVMARGNEIVQQRLFDRLDMLLNIPGAECEMAQALTEVFTGNKKTCLKVLNTQVQKIMMLVATHGSKAPQFLDLLNAIIKVDELDLPLKRNQGYVMKYFMEFRDKVASVIDRSSDKWRAILVGGSSPELDYMIALVDLLATCAEGENRYIESICQTIFSIKELLEILNDRKISNNLKRPYVRFLLWVYLNAVSDTMDSGAGDLPHDEDMWMYINSLTEDISTLTKYSQQSTETVEQLLKKTGGKCKQLRGDLKSHHDSLPYMMDAVMPFLQTFFRLFYEPDLENFPEEADHVDKLAQSLVEFSKTVGPLLSNSTHMKNMVACVNVVLSESTVPVETMKEFQEKYGGANTVQDVRSDARKAYDEYYQKEEELNAQLKVFAVNYSAAYGGFNDVKTQIGYPTDEMYTELGGDEQLPLGKEFQAHLNCFMDKKEIKNKIKNNPIMKCELAGKLVQQLEISASAKHMNEKERLNQEALDIKCLQVLRGFIHNEIVKLPEDWEYNIKAHLKQLKKIEDVQNALNSQSAMLRVLPLLANTRDDIVREVLAFLAAILFNGNEQVQKSLIDYFRRTRDEKFFFAIKNRMNLSAIATKERRSLIIQHQAKKEEVVVEKKALKKAMESARQGSNKQMGSMLLSARHGSCVSMASNVEGRRKKSLGDMLKNRFGRKSPMGSRLSLNSSTSNLQTPRIPMIKVDDASSSGANMELMPMSSEDTMSVIIKDNKAAPQNTPEVEIEEVDDQELEEFAASKVDNDSLLEYRDDGYIELVLRILGLMCDGQNAVLQDYLREQPDNIKSVNLIAETVQFLQLIYSSINNKTIALITQLFNTLVEFCSGNHANQAVVFDNKICDYINYILRSTQFQGCSPLEIYELKKSISVLIQALIEENPQELKDFEGTVKILGVAREVKDSIDHESIWKCAVECYSKCQGNPAMVVECDDIKQTMEVEDSNNHKSIWQSAAKYFSKNQSKDVVPKEKAKMKEFVMKVGFSYYHILKRLMFLDGDDENKRISKLLRSDLDDLDDLAWKYYEGDTLSIEVLKDDALQKIYFRCRDKTVLREDVKEKFKYEVDRSSPRNKLREFMDWSKDIMADIKYTRHVLSNPISKFFVKYWYPFNIIMILLSFAHFLLVMTTWSEPHNADGASDFNNTVPEYTSTVQIVTYVLGGLHNFITFCVFISYFITNNPTFPKCQSIRRMKKWLMHEEEDEEVQRVSHLEVKFLSFKTFWYIMLMVCSFLGTLFYGYFFSFHLLHMAEFNQLLKRAIKAVSKNGLSLLWVFFYGLCFLYIFALLSFAFYRESYDTREGKYCTTMFECFVTTFHRGLITPTFEYLEIPEDKPFMYVLHKAIFDLSFYIIISTIGLNIIFGIIVDTFSELRDDKWNVDNDMHTMCFICNQSGYLFDQQAGGFENHVKLEHCLWSYLFFFIHLDETRVNDYTALELYVFRMLEKQHYDFFPLNRSLSLQHEKDRDKQKSQNMMDQVTYMVNRMRAEEALVQRQEEKKKQVEWERKHSKKLKRQKTMATIE